MTLYAAKGGSAASDLYTVDPSDGSTTSIGPTGFAITGLAFDPTDGILYGVTSNNSPANPRSLITVNPATGAGTLVGALGIGSDTLSDIAFKSNGTLYGYSALGHKLYTVNLATGAATQVSATTILGGYGFAMDFDAEDNLFVAADGDDLVPPSDLLLVDETDASHRVFSNVGGAPPYGNGASFAAGTFADAFYAIDNDFGSSAHLVTIDFCSGVVTDIGVTLTGLDALASDTRTTDTLVYTFAAQDIINGSSTTASVVSGRVRETASEYWADSATAEIQPDAALKFTWTGAPALYKVTCTGRYPTIGVGTFGHGHAHILVAVNGRPILPVQAHAFFAFATDDTWDQYPGLPDGVYDSTAYSKAPWVPLSPGDQVEVFIASDSQTAGPTAFLPFHLEEIAFSCDGFAPATSFCTPAFSFPELPLGDQWGSAMGWGGQWFVPDEIYTLLGVTRYDESVFNPWTINYTDYDFAALADGTVYAIVHDAWNAGAGSPGTDYHYIVIRKYDPGSDTWTQVDTLNIRPPTDRYMAEAVSCKYDGTYIYFVWWELHTLSAGPKYLWKWHCKRLDPTDDSIIELGTGQNAYGVTAQVQNNPEAGLASSIACPGNGDVYVGAIETPDDGLYAQRLNVWRWNGSAWADTSLPAPSVVGGTWRVVGENGFYDVLSSMVCARTDEGEVTDGVTLVYCYQDDDYGDRLVTIAYSTGGGWAADIITTADDVEGGATPRYGTAFPESLEWIDLDLLWSTKLGKLVLAVDFFLSSPGSENIWDVVKMNDAGTQWEVYEPLAPASVSGPWNQSRNTAEIGPDGEVYAARFSTTTNNDAINDFFQAKLLKTSPGYMAGFAVAGVPGLGELTPNPWIPFLGSTSHWRIRMVGSTAYIMGNHFMVETDPDFDGETGSEGEGIYMFKLTYHSCGGIVSLSHLRVAERYGERVTIRGS